MTREEGDSIQYNRMCIPVMLVLNNDNFFGVKTTLLRHFVSKSSVDAFSLQLLSDSAQVAGVRIPKTVETEYV